DVALGIDDHARTERTLADGAFTLPKLLPAGTAKEVIEEVVHPAAIVILPAAIAAAATNVLYGRFRVDVDHARFHLLRDLGEGVRHLRRRRQGQRRGIALLPSFFALHSVGDHRADQNPDRQRSQNRQRIGPATSLDARPHCARIHRSTSLRNSKTYSSIPIYTPL